MILYFIVCIAMWQAILELNYGITQSAARLDG